MPSRKRLRKQVQSLTLLPASLALQQLKRHYMKTALSSELLEILTSLTKQGEGKIFSLFLDAPIEDSPQASYGESQCNELLGLILKTWV